MFAQDGDFHQTFQDAPHRSSILNERTMKFSGCSARECDFERKNDEMFRGGQFSGCSAGSAIFLQIFRRLRERALHQNFQDAPHGSAACFKIFRMLAWERDFLQNKTTLNGAFWYRIGIGFIP